MIFLAVAVLAGFLALALLDVVWVFWLFGIVYICVGIGVGSDDRVRDRRFKTGFKGNERDTSDIATGAKFVALGVTVCALAYFAREFLHWASQLSTASSSWWDLYAWMVGVGLLALLIAFVIVKRMIPTAQTNSHGMPEPENHHLIQPDEAAVERITPQSKIDQDVLRVLLYVGKADGQLRAPEKSVIYAALMRLGSNLTRNEVAIDELLTRTEVPSQQAFKLAVGRLSQSDPSALRVVLAAAKQIVATQKTIHAAEEDALDYLQKRIGRTSDA